MLFLFLYGFFVLHRGFADFILEDTAKIGRAGKSAGFADVCHIMSALFNHIAGYGDSCFQNIFHDSISGSLLKLAAEMEF